jgi:hypothetical protein
MVGTAVTVGFNHLNAARGPVTLDVPISPLAKPRVDESHEMASIAASLKWLDVSGDKVKSQSYGVSMPPAEVPLVDTEDPELRGDAERIARLLPGFTLTHSHVLRWSDGDTEHFEFESPDGAAVTVFVDRLIDRLRVTTPGVSLLSVERSASGNEIVLMATPNGANVLHLVTHDGLHVKVASAAGLRSSNVSTDLITKLAMSALDTRMEIR